MPLTLADLLQTGMAQADLPDAVANPPLVLPMPPMPQHRDHGIPQVDPSGGPLPPVRMTAIHSGRDLLQDIASGLELAGRSAMSPQRLDRLQNEQMQYERAQQLMAMQQQKADEDQAWNEYHANLALYQKAQQIEAARRQAEAEAAYRQQMLDKPQLVTGDNGEAVFVTPSGKVTRTGVSVQQKTPQDSMSATELAIAAAQGDPTALRALQLQSQSRIDSAAAAAGAAAAAASRVRTDPKRVLSVEEAQALGVPYGTTAGQAAQQGVVPARQRSAKSQEAIANFDTAISTLQQIQQMFESNPQWVGGLASIIGGNKAGGTVGRLKEMTGNIGSDEALFRTMVMQDLNNAIKQLSGSAVTGNELQRMMRGLPNVGMSPPQFRAAVLASLNRLQKMRMNYEKRTGVAPIKQTPQSGGANDPLGLFHQ